jgi:hypothetical protein
MSRSRVTKGTVMSAVSPAAPAALQQAAVEAALVLLERMGLSPADLVAEPRDRAVVPTFAEYVPVVSAAVSARTRRAYGSYWNRIVEHWCARRLDEPTPSEIRQLMTWVKTADLGCRRGPSAPKRYPGKPLEPSDQFCATRSAIINQSAAAQIGGSGSQVSSDGGRQT